MNMDIDMYVVMGIEVYVVYEKSTESNILSGYDTKI